jgi:hypothetical protein
VILASLLARATASTFLCNRRVADARQRAKPYFVQLPDRKRMERAPWMNNVRRYRLPRLLMPPKDGSIADGDLLGYESKPGGEVAALSLAVLV